MEIKDYIEQYQQEGGYIKALRKHIGHAPIITIGVGVILTNDKGEILLQKRKDNGRWGIIGGGMEIGESFEETVRREAREEAGIELGEVTLAAVCNGPDRFIKYPNEDIVYSSSIVFRAHEYFGEIKNDPEEVFEHRFFSKENIPAEMNEFDRLFLEIWEKGEGKVAMYNGAELKFS